MTFFSFIKPYRIKIFILLFFVLIINLLSLALPWGIKMIIDDALLKKDLQHLSLIIFGLFLILIFRLFLDSFRKITSNLIGEKIVCDLREKIYDHVHRLPISCMKSMTPPQILTRITTDVDSVRRFIFSDAIESIYAALSFGLIVFVLLYINMSLTFLAILTLPLFAMMYLRIVPRLKEGYDSLREISSNLTSRMSEVFNAISVVRIFTAEGHEKDFFYKKQDSIFNLAKKNHSMNIRLWTGIDFFTSSGVLIVLLVGGWDVIDGKMTSGELIAFYSYLGMLFAPLVRLVVINSSYQEAKTSLRRINELMRIDNSSLVVSSSVVLSSVKGPILFDDVSFSYQRGEKILQNINFSVKKGEVVGIAGPSGSGKSTLMNLLVKFFEPDRGDIKIDGYSLKQLDTKTYRQRMSVVLQDDYLFSGTIYDNIRYGSFGAPAEEVRRSAQLAEADEFIQNFKKGYMTQVGYKGMNLSAGQRQRIAIARALIRKPAILILDEATSSLDAITENKVQKSIYQEMKGKIVFIIAHRFSTITNADKIIILEGGKITDMGSHDYLLNKGGIYSNLYFEQFKESDRLS